MQFQEHGVFEVKIEQGYLLVDATGPFNDEFTKQYQQAIDKCLQQMRSTCWDQIIILRQLSLFTPDAEALLVKTLHTRKQKGLNKSAVVLINIEGKSLITQQLQRIYQSAQVEHAFFTDVEQAKAWLQNTLTP